MNHLLILQSNFFFFVRIFLVTIINSFPSLRAFFHYRQISHSHGEGGYTFWVFYHSLSSSICLPFLDCRGYSLKDLWVGYLSCYHDYKCNEKSLTEHLLASSSAFSKIHRWPFSYSNLWGHYYHNADNLHECLSSFFDKFIGYCWCCRCCRYCFVGFCSDLISEC